jgi:hypothetical protein
VGRYRFAPLRPEIVGPTIEWFDNLNLRPANPYGFKATFNHTFALEEEQVPFWVSSWHYGLNQGPIILMIENFRSSLLWRLMARCPYLVAGLRRAGFAGGWLESAHAT